MVANLTLLRLDRSWRDETNEEAAPSSDAVAEMLSRVPHTRERPGTTLRCRLRNKCKKAPIQTVYQPSGFAHLMQSRREEVCAKCTDRSLPVPVRPSM